ncbi:restriction endonuclease subunit S [Clostridium sp. BJN0013]|uniref:restriction endonuclease subunit S n=1 Tax=Clostridium sp. BJN0013 TaxID=3236840 RepID=UPI0034C6D225
MDKNKANVPKIRFPEFTDPWEQRKLGEISDKVTEKNTGNFYDETLTNSAEFGIVTQRDFFDKDISNAKNLNGYYVVQNDDFVYNPRISNFAPVGPIKRNKLARTGVMSPLYYVFRTHDIDKTYLEHYFDTTCWHSFMKLNGDSGARADRFAIKDSVFIEMPIPFPNLEEQKKIGKFFDTITILITLHQRKLNHLQDKKKSLLQKMFPKNGEDFPELRFPGFTDPWEQRKLSEVATIKARIGWQGLTQKEFLDEGDYYLITGTDFDNGQIDFSNCHYISKERYNQDANIQVKNGDVLITKDGTIGKVAYIRNMDKPATLNAGVFVIKGKDKSLSDLYLYHYLAAPFLLDYADKQATGGTIKHLNQNVLVSFPIPLPKVKEQKEIGQFFSKIDNLITLHQRKLNHLQEQKKSLLQQMFI